MNPPEGANKEPAKLSRFLPYVTMLLVVGGNVMGNVLIKVGASPPPGRAYLFGLFGWQTAAGIGCFGASVLLYAWTLRYLPLHVAQAVASLQFVGAVLAAAFLLGETITPQTWLGIVFIWVGLSIVLH
jgi:drug/metabolite transporter (DMT)-like permease